MKRFGWFLCASLAFLPALAGAQASLSGSATGGVEHSSNVYSVPEDDADGETADQIVFVTPSLKAALVTRGVDLSADYTLGYYHYQAEQDLSRALHRLAARAALVWWDNVDLELVGRLDPRVVSYNRPLDDPRNQMQQAAVGGRFMLRRELGAATRGSVGYRGEQVTWLEAHEDDEDRLPPDYLTHGPELILERDVGRRLVVGVEYQFRLQTYDDEAAGNAPRSADYTSHTGTGRLGLDATDWLSLSMAYGFSQIEYAKGEDVESLSTTRALADVRVTAGGEVARISASARQNSTQDILGNPATTRFAKLGADYTPYAPWGIGVAASYGEIDYEDLATQVPGTPQAFVAGEASLFYRISVGELSIGANHHESVPEGSDAKIVVNRASVRLGGRF